MVTTTRAMPSHGWRPFIKCFALREFDAGDSPLVRPLPAMSEFMLSFNLTGERIEHYGHPDDGPAGVRRMKNISWVTGLFGDFMGLLSFSGKHRQFTIEFTATGFFNIFKVPATEFTSRAFAGTEVFGGSMALFEEQLCEAKSLDEMTSLSERFLRDNTGKGKSSEDAAAIHNIAEILEHSSLPASMDELAGTACMSLKSLERKFREQVGVTPKYFSRILRFNRALRMKIMEPRETWTSVAHATGYFDQMHFIKDFKQFTGMNPADFLHHLPPPVEMAAD